MSPLYISCLLSTSVHLQEARQKDRLEMKMMTTRESRGYLRRREVFVRVFVLFFEEVGLREDKDSKRLSRKIFLCDNREDRFSGTRFSRDFYKRSFWKKNKTCLETEYLTLHSTLSVKRWSKFRIYLCCLSFLVFSHPLSWGPRVISCFPEKCSRRFPLLRWSKNLRMKQGIQGNNRNANNTWF